MRIPCHHLHQVLTALGALVVALLVTALSVFAYPTNVAPRTFTDDLGREIALPKVPQRLVSLAPSVTEILYAIGLGDRVVGVTEFCDYPLDARTKPKVGYARPNIESIVALHPDLVLAPSAFLRPDMLTKLEQLKIATFISEPQRVEDLATQIQMVGRMLNRSESADRVAAELRHQLTELNAKTAGLSRPRVLYVLNSQPLITVGPGSFIHQLIEMAGGANVAARAASPYPRLSIEEVLAQDPQMIIFPVGSSEGIPPEEQVLWRRWNTMTAVKMGSFYRIGSDLLNRPGPRIILGLKKLIEIIHPEVFLFSDSQRNQP